jgi:heme b synthase
VPPDNRTPRSPFDGLRTSEFSPRLVFWETTAGCNLRCIHCRRIDVADQLVPEDLTLAESKALIDQIVAFSSPIFVLSGGEPLMRPDIFDIAGYAVGRGLRVALATNGTLIDDRTAGRIVDAGIRRVAVSLDGATAATHDAFRALPGSFDQAVRGIQRLRLRGMSVQINTTVARHNIEELPGVLELARSLGADALHVFLLVPVGCGVEIADEQMITPQEYERVLRWFYEHDREGLLELKATCAPHYFRIARQRLAAEKREMPPSHARQHAAGHPGSQGHPSGLHAMTKGCLAGTGVCFISHKGEVFPCGYLPLRAGSVREQTLQAIWEDSELFQTLRDPDRLEGKCGLCEFKRICAGCRARAYGMTGNYLGEEPFCIYEPRPLRAAAG